MSAVFKKVQDQMGLNDDSQGDLAWAAALLRFADLNHSGGDVLTNPYEEVVKRFEVAGLNPHAMKTLKQILIEGQHKFAAGRP
jgi:hypothetical protein